MLAACGTRAGHGVMGGTRTVPPCRNHRSREAGGVQGRVGSSCTGGCTRTRTQPVSHSREHPHPHPRLCLCLIPAYIHSARQVLP